MRHQRVVKVNLMLRLRAFVMWLLGYVLPTDMYLRLNGYNPDEIAVRMGLRAKQAIAKIKNETPTSNQT